MRQTVIRPTDAPSAANVLAVFRHASADDVQDGRDWYARARQACQEVAAQHLGSTDADAITRVAVVYAIISPSTPWARNDYLARLAFSLASEGKSFDAIVEGLPMLGANARKAAAVVLGADPWSVISGPKVIPFAQRIIDAASDNGGPGSVVIDRHAHDIALGKVTDDKVRGINLGRKGGHHAFAMAYVRAASVLRRTGECAGITPAELQAVTWIVWRREFGHAQAKSQARRDAGK